MTLSQQLSNNLAWNRFNGPCLFRCVIFLAYSTISAQSKQIVSQEYLNDTSPPALWCIFVLAYSPIWAKKQLLCRNSFLMAQRFLLWFHCYDMIQDFDEFQHVVNIRIQAGGSWKYENPYAFILLEIDNFLQQFNVLWRVFKVDYNVSLPLLD